MTQLYIYMNNVVSANVCTSLGSGNPEAKKKPRNKLIGRLIGTS